MQILPIDGLGVLVTGPEQAQPVEVWQDRIVALTRLPGGRCLLPMLEGPVRVERQGQVLARAHIDCGLVPKGAGRFAIEGPGTVDAWMFLPELDVGVLAGERPSASAPQRLDLAKRAMPHRIMSLAVQVRDGQRRGPIRFFTYRPDARAAAVEVDHASSHNGPLTHIRIDPGGLDRVQVEVVRRIRQTGQERSSRYEINTRDDVITFEDLLHDDRIEITASPPFALAGAQGPVQARTFRYRAVPEPRLEPTGDEAPVQARGGLTARTPQEARGILEAVAPAALTWQREWPVAAADETVSLDAALTKRGAPASVARDPGEMAWWLAAIEAGQDPAAAARLQQLRIQARPAELDRIAAAVDALEGFPAHIFAELDGKGPSDAIVAFQERLGMADQDGAQAAQLADAARQALDAAAAAWHARLVEAGMDWVDGTLAPLHDVDDAQALAARIAGQPAAALADLWDRRNRVWRVVPGDAQRPIDVRIRRTLVAWHIQQTQQVLERLGRSLARLGAQIPTDIDDMASMPRRLNDVLRAAEPALARLSGMPEQGSRWLEGALAAALQQAEADRDALATWTRPGVPGAVRSQVERMAQRWGPMLERLHAWRTLVDDAPRLEGELDALAAAGGPEAKQAAAVRESLADAVQRGDPARLASVMPALQGLEPALQAQADAWQRAMEACSPGTREALGLDGIEPWPQVQARLQDDLDVVRELAHHVARLDRRRSAGILMIVDEGGEMDRAARALAVAPPGQAAADALVAYDQARQRIPERLGGSEAVESLQATWLELLRNDLQRRIRWTVGRSTQAAAAALDANRDIEGASDLRIVILAAEQELDLDTTARLAEVMDDLERDQAWGRVQERIRTRLRAASADLARYMGDQAPRWSVLDDPAHALQWLYALSHGRRDELTGTDLAALPLGNRRLVEHTLRQQGLWFV